MIVEKLAKAVLDKGYSDREREGEREGGREML